MFVYFIRLARMKRSLTLLLFLGILVSGCKKNPPYQPEIEFEHTYIKTGNQVANRMIALADRLAIIGTNVSANPTSIDMTFVDFNGELLLSREVGSGTEGAGLKYTQDNGLILVGSITDENGDKNVYLAKTDTDGTLHWERNFGGPLSDQGRDVIELENGAFMIIGTTQSFGAGVASMYVIRTDFEGNEIWSRTFGGEGLDGGSELVQVNSFEVMLLGFTESFGAGGRDIYLQSVSTDGDSLWSSTYGGSGYEESQSIARTSDGGFIMCNHSASNEPNHSIVATKMNSNGQVVWEQEFGTATAHEGGEGVLADSEGNYVFLGRSNSFSDDEQVYLIKTDATGNVLEEWVEGFELNDQRGNDIIEHDGSYFICGTSSRFSSSFVMLKKRPMNY